jgi:predicted GNAT family acetyltransferase
MALDAGASGKQAGAVEDTKTVSVTDAAERNRFEAHIGGALAGFAQYIRTAELVVYPHTEVDLAFEGRGVGGALAQAALDDARERGLTILATCPFIAGWMSRHPDYADLAYQNRSRVSD